MLTYVFLIVVFTAHGGLPFLKQSTQEFPTKAACEGALTAFIEKYQLPRSYAIPYKECFTKEEADKMTVDPHQFLK
jgi:hypothetical protein